MDHDYCSSIGKVTCQENKEKPDKVKYACEECDSKYATKYNLKRHIESSHLSFNKPSTSSSSLSKTTKFVNNCPLCEMKGTKRGLIHHYKTIHSTQIVQETFTFTNRGCFEEWKATMEKETTSKFITFRGVWKSGDRTKMAFVCHRDGQFVSESSGQRALKTTGSSKINGYCPARVDAAIMPDGSFQVEFTKTHVGHSNEVGLISLTKVERESIATKIALKVPLTEILDEIRNSLYNSDVERIHLTTRQDLFNIIQEFNLNKDAVSHQNDYVSVDSWVKHSSDTNIVRFYKPQGEDYPGLRNEDFMLILSNDAQLEIFKKYGNDIVCIDGTHGLNPYNFQMYTVMVIDDMREGFPVSFLFSNREDTYVMQIYFQKLKEALGGPIETKYFMSDMADSFFLGWSAVMPTMSTKQLYCSWHVDRAWRANLCKIKNKTKQVEIYKHIKTLSEFQNINIFQVALQNFISGIQRDAECILFARYFNKFKNNAETWARCYRMNAGINTNMHLENMHRNLKYIYLEGRKVKRLDKAICALMKFTKNKLFDKLISLNKGKVTKKLSSLRNRHREALKIKDQFLSLQEGDGIWRIKSVNSTNNFLVKFLKAECPCRLRCSECQVCIHTYTCTCSDSSIKWNMCKHIHLMHILGMKTPVSNHPSEDSELVCILKEVSVLNKPSTDFNDSSKAGSSLDLNNEKKKIMEDFMAIMDNISTPDELGVVKKQLAPLNIILSSLKKKRKFEEDTKETILKNLTKEPANKKITPQRGFISTKKKRKSLDSTINKPSTKETSAIRNKLLSGDVL